MLANKLLSTVGSDEKLYPEDVFSTYLYTGNGSTQTITNGIDLAGKGGLVWIKERGASFGHYLADTVRGNQSYLKTFDTTAAQTGVTDRITSFNSSGFSLGANAATNSALGYASWTFRRATKFFDVVTYTGNGGTKVVSHALGSAPGMIVVKRTDTTGDWPVYHRSESLCGFLNYTNSFASAQRFSSVTSTDFTINVSTADVNASGDTYVAYLFAHDTSTDGIIQCGSFTTDGSGNATVNLGWEPQYLMVKASSTTSDWYLIDSNRGFTNGGNEAQLWANLASAESVGNMLTPSATGFSHVPGGFLPSSTTAIYVAIRRPNKPPTTGTQVYNAIARTGTGAAATVTGVGFAPDLVISKFRSVTGEYGWNDRARGALKPLFSNSTAVENTYSESDTLTGFDVSDGIRIGSDGSVGYINNTSKSIITHFFKRSVGCFDVVCWTASNSTNASVNHNLAAVPELVIIKRRDGSNNWGVYHASLGNNKYLYLNLANGDAVETGVWPTGSTSSVLRVNESTFGHGLSAASVAYLFATKAGISKVGSFTKADDNFQTINCGFSTGARFVMIKRTSATGGWYVWDTVRGIVAANDPYLFLNSTAAEDSSFDFIDPVSSGFQIGGILGNGDYIYLAYA